MTRVTETSVEWTDSPVPGFFLIQSDDGKFVPSKDRQTPCDYVEHIQYLRAMGVDFDEHLKILKLLKNMTDMVCELKIEIRELRKLVDKT